MNILPYGLSPGQIRVAAIIMTMAELRILYGSRPLTFFIWTNAALIDHTYPRVTVTVLEAVIALACYSMTFWLVDAVDYWIYTKRSEPRRKRE